MYSVAFKLLLARSPTSIYKVQWSMIRILKIKSLKKFLSKLSEIRNLYFTKPTFPYTAIFTKPTCPYTATLVSDLNFSINITVLKSKTFSVVNPWVLRGHCDRLRNCMTLSFVIYLVLLKGTVQRDFFRPPVFFIIRTSLGHWPMG